MVVLFLSNWYVGEVWVRRVRLVLWVFSRCSIFFRFIVFFSIFYVFFIVYRVFCGYRRVLRFVLCVDLSLGF